MPPGGISSEFSCTRSLCQSTNLDSCRSSSHSLVLVHWWPGHFCSGQQQRVCKSTEAAFFAIKKNHMRIEVDAEQVWHKDMHTLKHLRLGIDDGGTWGLVYLNCCSTSLTISSHSTHLYRTNTRITFNRSIEVECDLGAWAKRECKLARDQANNGGNNCSATVTQTSARMCSYLKVPYNNSGRTSDVLITVPVTDTSLPILSV